MDGSGGTDSLTGTVTALGRGLPRGRVAPRLSTAGRSHRRSCRGVGGVLIIIAGAAADLTAPVEPGQRGAAGVRPTGVTFRYRGRCGATGEQA